MTFPCRSCGDFFGSVWALNAHTRRNPECAPLRRKRLACEHSRNAKRTRPLQVTFPLSQGWDADNGPHSSEQEHFGPRRQLDAVIVGEGEEYWDESLQNFPKSVPEYTPPSEPRVDPSVITDPLGKLDIAYASEAEVLVAGREAIVAAAEKAGRGCIDAILRMATSKQWAKLFHDPGDFGGAPSRGVSNTASLQPGEVDSLRSVQNAMLAINRQTKREFAELGFQSQLVFPRTGSVHDPTSSRLEVFRRSAVEVVRTMLSKASKKKRNFYFDPVRLVNRRGDRVVSHPMSGDVAHVVLKSVKRSIFDSPDPGTFWSPDSFVVMLQFYSDKSCMSLKSNAFSFYPFHISVLNFTAAAREEMIRRGDSLVAFLPTSASWASLETEKLRATGEPFSSRVERDVVDEGDEGATERPPRNQPRRSAPGAECSLPDRLPYTPESREILVAAHSCVLAELKSLSASGITFRDADGVTRKGHPILVSYAADTVERVAICCCSSNRCTNCDIQKSSMGSPGVTGTQRSASGTFEALFIDQVIAAGYTSDRAKRDPALVDHLRGIARDTIGAQAASSLNHDSIEKMMRNFETNRGDGLTRTRPYLLDWPFTSTDQSLELYTICRFDLMHAMPLGLLKTIVTLVTLRFASTSLRTRRFLDSRGNPRTFLSMRKRFLSAANQMLREIDRDSHAVDFSVDFYRGKTSSELDGLFTKTGVASMLEAKDMLNVQQVLPFVAGFLDSLSTLPDSSKNSEFESKYSSQHGRGRSLKTDAQRQRAAPLTEVFVAYNDLYQKLCRKGQDEPGFTEADLCELTRAIASFKHLAVDVFGEFQKSKFNFPKFHSLEHVVQDIREVGSPAYHSTAVYEASHVYVKNKNRSTSRRRGTTMMETVVRIAREQGMSRLRSSRVGGHCLNAEMVEYLAAGKRPTRRQSGGHHRYGNAEWSGQLAKEGRVHGPTEDCHVGSNHEDDPDSREESNVLISAIPPIMPDMRRESRSEVRSVERAARLSEQISQMTPREAAVATDSCCLARGRGGTVKFKSIIAAVRAIDRNRTPCGVESDQVNDRSTEQSVGTHPSALSEAQRFISSLGGYALATKALDILLQQALAAQPQEDAEVELGADSRESHPHAGFIENSLRLQVVKSAHVAGFPVPSAESQVDARLAEPAIRSDGEGKVELHDDGTRVRQKIICGLSYSHRNLRWQDSVMIEGEGAAEDSPEGHHNQQAQVKKMAVWFARVLVFMHATADGGTFHGGAELAVVRYYKVLPKTDLDPVDVALGCISMKWSQDEHGDPWIDIVPASSIRGRVHVVRCGVPPPGIIADSSDEDSDSGSESDADSTGRSSSDDAGGSGNSCGVAIFADSEDWKARRFYVNRFKVSSEEVYSIHDVGNASEAVHHA